MTAGVLSRQRRGAAGTPAAGSIRSAVSRRARPWAPCGTSHSSPICRSCSRGGATTRPFRRLTTGPPSSCWARLRSSKSSVPSLSTW